MNLNGCALETTCVEWQFINWEKVTQITVKISPALGPGPGSGSLTPDFV